MDHEPKPILTGLTVRREPTVEPDEAGTYLLRHGPVFRKLVALYVGLTTTLLVLGCTATRHDPSALLVVATVFGGMWLASLTLGYEVFAVELRADAGGVTRLPLLGRARRLEWGEVDRVDHSEAFHRLAFRAAGRRPVRVSLYRDGLVTLSELAEARLAPEVADEARVGLSPRRAA